jgi:hypothetical protein
MRSQHQTKVRAGLMRRNDENLASCQLAQPTVTMDRLARWAV